MSTSLEPASSIIRRFGGSDAVRKITGASRTRVYRWTLPKHAGGTGGVIPFKHIPALIEAARAEGIDLSANDFLPATSPERAA